jgi:hypothetical protein
MFNTLINKLFISSLPIKLALFVINGIKFAVRLAPLTAVEVWFDRPDAD